MTTPIRTESNTQPNIRANYFTHDSQLATAREFNQMSRAQLIHELRARGHLEAGEEEEMTDWRLRLRMRFVVDTEEEITDETQIALQREEQERRERDSFGGVEVSIGS